MVARGDRDHDIAAWFGVNQGRIAEVKDGSKFGSVAAASASQLPPRGAPGIKGRRLRGRLDSAIAQLGKDGASGKGLAMLSDALSEYDNFLRPKPSASAERTVEERPISRRGLRGVGR